MNQAEWRKLNLECKSLINWSFYHKTRAIQKSLQYNKDPNAVVIHHLRDTEEQRKYNDEHYELWGHNLDGSFEYDKYVVFVTKEEHTEIHRCSEETRKKRSKSMKKVQRTAEWNRKISESNRGRICSDEQRKQISESVSNLWKSEDYREHQSKATKEAIWRPDVRQRYLDGCKKRSPISKEARAKAAEANKGKHHSDETKSFLSASKKEYYRKLHTKQASEFDFNLELSNLKKYICEKYKFNIESIHFIFSFILSQGNLDKYSNASTIAGIFNKINETLPLKWNIFQSIFFSIRKLFIKGLFYEQYK